MMNEVFVCCRIPMGVVLEVYAKGQIEQVKDRGKQRNVQGNVKFNSRKFTLLGKHNRSNRTAKGLIIDPEGYPINRVPEDFWEAWKEQNANSPLLKEGLIVSRESEKSTKKATIDAKANRSIDEPVLQNT